MRFLKATRSPPDPSVPVDAPVVLQVISPEPATTPNIETATTELASKMSIDAWAGTKISGKFRCALTDATEHINIIISGEFSGLKVSKAPTIPNNVFLLNKHTFPMKGSSAQLNGADFDVYGTVSEGKSKTYVDNPPVTCFEKYVYICCVMFTQLGNLLTYNSTTSCLNTGTTLYLPIAVFCLIQLVVTLYACYRYQRARNLNLRAVNAAEKRAEHMIATANKTTQQGTEAAELRLQQRIMAVEKDRQFGSQRQRQDLLVLQRELRKTKKELKRTKNKVSHNTAYQQQVSNDTYEQLVAHLHHTNALGRNLLILRKGIRTTENACRKEAAAQNFRWKQEIAKTRQEIKKMDDLWNGTISEVKEEIIGHRMKTFSQLEVLEDEFFKLRQGIAMLKEERRQDGVVSLKNQDLTKKRQSILYKNINISRNETKNMLAMLKEKVNSMEKAVAAMDEKKQILARDVTNLHSTVIGSEAEAHGRLKVLEAKSDGQEWDMTILHQDSTETKHEIAVASKHIVDLGTAIAGYVEQMATQSIVYENELATKDDLARLYSAFIDEMNALQKLLLIFAEKHNALEDDHTEHEQSATQFMALLNASIDHKNDMMSKLRSPTEPPEPERRRTDQTLVEQRIQDFENHTNFRPELPSTNQTLVEQRIQDFENHTDFRPELPSTNQSEIDTETTGNDLDPEEEKHNEHEQQDEREEQDEAKSPGIQTSTRKRLQDCEDHTNLRPEPLRIDKMITMDSVLAKIARARLQIMTTLESRKLRPRSQSTATI